MVRIFTGGLDERIERAAGGTRGKEEGRSGVD